MTNDPLLLITMPKRKCIHSIYFFNSSQLLVITEEGEIGSITMNGKYMCLYSPDKVEVNETLSTTLSADKRYLAVAFELVDFSTRLDWIEILGDDLNFELALRGSLTSKSKNFFYSLSFVKSDRPILIGVETPIETQTLSAFALHRDGGVKEIEGIFSCNNWTSKAALISQNEHQVILINSKGSVYLISFF